MQKPEQPEQKGVEKGIQNVQEPVIKPPELEVKETNPLKLPENMSAEL